MPGGPLDRFVESSIDAALRTYAEPPVVASDPRTAAAAILERALEPQRRRSWWAWAVPAGAAVAAVVVVLVLSLRTPTAPSISSTPVPLPTAATPHAMPSAPVASPVRPMRRLAHLPSPHAAPLPEQTVFPTPAPLSNQEQALIMFARTAPPAVRQSVIDEQSRWGEEAKVGASSVPPGSNTSNAEPGKENQ